MDFLAVLIASIFSLFNFAQLAPLEAGPLTGLAAVSATFFDEALQPHAVVLFGGDMMFDRSMRVASEKNGGDLLLTCMDGVLFDSDLTIANLEGPITTSASISVGSKPGAADNFVFTFPWSTASLLKKHHIDMVNLGNNHILNFGYSGVRQTIQALDEAKVAYFGDPIADTMIIKKINGVPLAFISYNEFGPYGAKFASATTIDQIKEAKMNGYLPIVYTHWGTEYLPTAPQYIRDRAHTFVDAGASAVIGSHPHVVQDHEIYKDAPIYYSLGNFVFDQYFEEAVSKGLFIKVTLGGEGVETIEEIPITLNRDRTVCPIAQ